MTPALLLAALAGVSEPTPQGAHMAPQCFPSMIDAAVFLIAWGETVQVIEARPAGQVALFADPRDGSWSIVTEDERGLCISEQSGEPL